ncbi:Recombination protein recR [Metamycoplasma cloacale]|uniref:Recombination protein RecR n=1 Tax=Metamycoplasma cloacale TaxID=92401 RepID=A0A2Z4LMB6_9BACT|nr:toprim domain-containing protein [Metamycoplasma cloacale]AWX42915.1 recombination protein RecR [Metamycoplasma cloacale]VEU79261.1 Recombination protein recR [Metamycoplasma cloacale]
MNKYFEELELLLKKIPGFSKKQIQKTIAYIIESNDIEINELIQKINNLKQNIKKCDICNCYTTDANCSICIDKTRSRSLFVVENHLDVQKIENLDFYKGYYFVLEGLYKLKDNENKVLNNIDKLIELGNKYNEIILGLPATLEGHFSMEYLKKLLKKHYPNLSVYQLSMGLPMGSTLEYIDPITLKQSLINKIKM